MALVGKIRPYRDHLQTGRLLSKSKSAKFKPECETKTKVWRHKIKTNNLSPRPQSSGAKSKIP